MTLTMERPERYDPEDIEHLMLERSFDELLAEEKSFVLRHLQDGAEYERMRALLLHMQLESGPQESLDADPEVRERVLQVFREERQPKWRIWLNSVGTFLVPARPVHYWRPALALGAVALLVVSSLSLWNMVHEPNIKVLADLKEVKPAPEHRQAEVKAAEGSAEAEPAAPPAEKPNNQVERERPMEFQQIAASTTPKEKLEGYAAMEEPAAFEAADMANVEAAPPVLAEVAMDKDAKVATRAMAESGVRSAAGMATEGTLASTHSEDALLGLLRAAW